MTRGRSWRDRSFPELLDEHLVRVQILDSLEPLASEDEPCAVQVPREPFKQFVQCRLVVHVHRDIWADPLASQIMRQSVAEDVRSIRAPLPHCTTSCSATRRSTGALVFRALSYAYWQSRQWDRPS